MAHQHASWIKPTRWFGLSLFVISMISFIILMFQGDYRLTQQTVDSKISSELKLSYFNASSSQLINTTYSDMFAFINEVERVFHEADRAIYEDCRITEDEINMIINRSKEGTMFVFRAERLDSIFDQSAEGQYKSKNIRDYNSWLEGREFLTDQDLYNHINSSVNSINAQLSNAKGFNAGQIANLKYEFALAANQGTAVKDNGLWLFLVFGFGVIGALIFIVPFVKEGPAGIKNNRIFQSSVTNVGVIGIITGAFLISFYIFLYEFPEYITSWILLVDPMSYAFNGGPASQWFLYGLLYTIAILVMGIRMIIKYRHNRYQIVRTVSVMFFQTAFAFVLIEIFKSVNIPAYDLKNIWPLDYSFFFDYRLNEYANAGTLGIWMIGWGIVLFAVGVPVLTYFFGKRWYCSWVCGCGGLAETLGDPYRQLSDKSLKAWNVERYLIHSVLVFSIIMTIGVVYTFFTDQYDLLGISTYEMRSSYAFLIGSIFSGIIGTGFYPLMGNRVWCRFGCPLAAYLGFVQRFKSRFRITTNGSQCISCGNCSTYCEMGIDVRWYAQREQDIVRSSCVGCGICAAVCPRGVLKLENGTVNLDQVYVETEELVK